MAAQEAGGNCGDNVPASACTHRGLQQTFSDVESIFVEGRARLWAGVIDRRGL